MKLSLEEVSTLSALKSVRTHQPRLNLPDLPIRRHVVTKGPRKLHPEPPFTLAQLNLAQGGLQHLSLPLLDYLDPEQHFGLSDSKAAPHYQHLVLHDAPLTNRRHAKRNMSRKGVRPLFWSKLPYWERTPRNLYHPSGLKAFKPEPELSGTPTALDHNLLLDVYGLLFQHTGFCTIPSLIPWHHSASPQYYQCLCDAVKAAMPNFYLFLLTEGGNSLTQSLLALYRPLYSAALNPSTSTVREALQARSAARAFSAAELPGQDAQAATSSVVSLHDLARGSARCYLPLGAQWTRFYQELKHNTFMFLGEAPSQNFAPMVGLQQRPWQNREHKSLIKTRKLDACWDDDALWPEIFAAELRHSDLIIDYLCTGLSRLCLCPSKSALSDLQEHYGTRHWELLIDGSRLARCYQSAAAANFSHKVPYRPEELKLLTPKALEQQVMGGSYRHHKVTLYALPQAPHPKKPWAVAPLALVSPWERPRLKAYWRKQAAAVISEVEYPTLFSHQGKSWQVSTINLYHELQQGKALTPRHLTYDGTEQARRALTGQMARDYCLEQNLTYGAGHNLRTAQLLSAPQSTIRTYLSEALRLNQVSLSPEVLTVAPSKQLLNLKQLEMQVLAEAGLNSRGRQYYERSLSEVRGERRKVATGGKFTAPPRKSRLRHSLPHLLTEPATQLYLNALVEQYYSELTLQGRMYHEHVRLPLAPTVTSSSTKVPPAILRLVLTALSARPDLHFCYAQISHPFSIDANVPSGATAHSRQSKIPLRVSLRRLVAAPPSASSPIKRAARQRPAQEVLPGGGRARPLLTTMLELGGHESDKSLQQIEQRHNFCDLTMYFTRPITHQERASNLRAGLKELFSHSDYHLPRRTRLERESQHRGERQIPTWSQEQLTQLQTLEHSPNPLTYAQKYVLRQLMHGQNLGAPMVMDTPHQECPLHQALRLSSTGHYQGQINFFLAASVYHGLQRISELRQLPPVRGRRSTNNLAPSTMQIISTQRHFLTRFKRHKKQRERGPFPSFSLFLYALEALECQEALKVQCNCSHSTLVFNPSLLIKEPEERLKEPEQLCPYCATDLVL